MKANELKVTDLMVGDWVMSFGAPHKIVGVRTDMLEPYIKTDMSDTWYEEGIEDLLEPIPLTPEILEKNGFEMFTYECDHSDVFVGIDDFVRISNYKIRTNNKWCVSVYNDNVYEIAHCELTYLHELQHLLKLCNIDFDWKV